MELYNSKGELTSYALSCGYVMKFNEKVKLVKINNTKNSYEVYFRNKSNEIRTYVFHNLNDAKKEGKRLAKIYK